MPGVPSGRGCEGCRRQKKKCDQRKPSCSRCTRLRMACIGAGQQRFKFKAPSVLQGHTVVQVQQAHMFNDVPALLPPPQLTTAATSLTAQLVRALEVDDPRFGLGCYGDVLWHVPRRLGQGGSPSALDAAVAALLGALPVHYGQEGGTVASGTVMPAYVESLRVLRMCLGQGGRVTADNLCAVYLIMICQGWIGRSDDHVRSHGKILAHLLSAINPPTHHDDFELSLIMTLSVPLIMEAMSSPTMTLSRQFISLVDACVLIMQPRSPNRHPHNAAPAPSLHISKLARIPFLLHAPSQQGPPVEIRETYKDMLADRDVLVSQLHYLDSTVSTTPHHNNHHNNSSNSKGQMQETRATLHSFETIYAMLLTIASTLNSLLRASSSSSSSSSPSPPSTDDTLGAEADMLANHLLELSRHAARYRPLGASYVPPCLAALWAAMEQSPRRDEVEGLIGEYQDDTPHVDWMGQARRMKMARDERRERRLAYPQDLSSPMGTVVGDGESGENSMVHCKAAFGPCGRYLFA